MKIALEQLCEDLTVVYVALHTLEACPEADPLRPELSELVLSGTAALLAHLVRLRARVQKYRFQCLLTPYARIRTNYLTMPSNSYSLDREAVVAMPDRELVLFLLDELRF